MAEALDAAIPDDIERLARDVLHTACNRNIRLATAESCTGGLLASLLTDIPGVSHAFEAGFVTYSDTAKVRMLGVPNDLLRRHGAVSKAAAVAMAEGALTQSEADLAVAITGYADAAPDGPAGLVHIACARRGEGGRGDRGRGGGTRHTDACFGAVGRAEVRYAALRVALRMMDDALADLARAA